MPGSEAAVDVRDLSVTYRTTLQGPPTIRGRLVAIERPRPRLVEALRDVDLRVARGQSVGIVGANGAGKSTLLRTVAGILAPTRGTVTTRGRVTALLRPSAAFNVRLSGRHNILLGGLAAGLTPAEVAGIEAAVAAFADLGDLIDAPLRAYSSGMVQRLSFAIAAHLRPDILLLDEGLSAGDEGFRARCDAHLRGLVEADTTLLMVSHNLGQLERLASRLVWLHTGRIRDDGPPGAVLAAYRAASRA